MKIAILGAGNVGGALGAAWARAGHAVTFGVRDPHAPRALDAAARAGGAALATPADAVRGADAVLLAVPYDGAESLVASLALDGTVLLDATNPLTPDYMGLVVGHDDSAGERIARAARGARVVKVFNATGAQNMADARYAGGAVTMPYAGDDGAAKELAASLARDAGLDPVDAGPLRNARLLEPLALLWIQIAYAQGHGPDVAFRLVRRTG